MNWYKVTIKERDKEKFEFILNFLNIKQDFSFIEEKNGKISCFLFLQEKKSKELFDILKTSLKRFKFIKVS